jgi:hypothetical protein
MDLPALAAWDAAANTSLAALDFTTAASLS